MVLPSQEIVNTPVCYSNKGICALLTQLSRRYIEKTMCTFPRDCTYSTAKLTSWLESILKIVTVFSSDQVIESRRDQPEWLQRASCRAAYGLQELKKKKAHWSQTFILFPSWVVFWLWLDAHNLMRGLPLVCGCICKPETVSVWYLDSTWLSAKIISFETHCCKLQNPAPIIHLVQTWILRVPGSPSTDSSVEVHEERRALQIFHT